MLFIRCAASFDPVVGKQVVPVQILAFGELAFNMLGCGTWPYSGMTLKKSTKQNFVVVGFFVAWYFQNYLFRNHHAWWTRYNYILSVGLDCGVAFAGLIITLLQETGAGFPIWWLNPRDREGYCRSS